MISHIVIIALALVVVVQGRFGQENPATIGKIRDCNRGGNGNINGRLAQLAGSSISTLLAAADPCAQQDKADEIIDFATANALPQACVQAAVELARAERNVNPFARANPCSDICGRLPRNAQLRGSVQAFDPACNLNAFLAANPQQQANLNLQRGGAGGGGAVRAQAQQNPKKAPQNKNKAQNNKKQPAPKKRNQQVKKVLAQAKNGGGGGGNLQQFAGALGGVRAPTVVRNGNQFQVQGNAAFNQLSSALERSCAVQHNQCANRANAGGNRNGLSVADCDRQQGQCDQFQRQRR